MIAAEETGNSLLHSFVATNRFYRKKPNDDHSTCCDSVAWSAGEESEYQWYQDEGEEVDTKQAQASSRRCRLDETIQSD